jgi:hypothetical protein
MSFTLAIHLAFSAFADHGRKIVQGKIATMRAPKALSITIAMFAILAADGVTFAQDAIPETPPELRDFRLDPQRPAPQPQPQAEPATERPVITPPPAVSTVPEQEAPQPRSQPQQQSTVVRPTTQAAPITPPEQATAEPQLDIAEPAIIDEAPAEIAPETEPVTETSATAILDWQIAAALGFIAILLLGIYWLRRRRKIVSMADAPIAESDYIKAVEPLESDLIITAPKQTSISKKPKIILDFIPEKATVSFTTLTIKGQLRLINEGDAVAKDMELRVGLISASAQQKASIKAFNADAANIPPEAIGEAMSGERIGMAIEISVPLSDMQSFPLGDQRLFAPIMVANLSYRGSSKGSTEIAHISCMIGREANPPASKMRPLRLDLGPRSFAPLGQRPLSM